MFRASTGLVTLLGVQGGMKLWQREADVEAWKQIGLPSWARNATGLSEAVGAVCILVPPLRPIGVFASSESVGQAVALGAFKEKSEVQGAVKTYLAPAPDTLLGPDNRNTALALIAVQLILTEWVACASGQRPLWLAAGLASGYWHGAGGWAQYPPEAREALAFNLPELVQAQQGAGSTEK
eukprot:Hpha_TRINITY_DN14814_c0_g1::TRINITY_DN14814_c0_g1_i1::g.169666::m.169666